MHEKKNENVKENVDQRAIIFETITDKEKFLN